MGLKLFAFTTSLEAVDHMRIATGQALAPPEYITKDGKGGGSINFLILARKWGVELLKNRSKIDEHMEHFEQGGKYYGRLATQVMEDYIVLDFTTSIPTKPRPNRCLLFLLT